MKHLPALFLTGLLLAAPARAALVFDITVDHATGGLGTPPFGTVTVTQVGANVDLLLHLASGFSFASTGAADFQAFKFNGTGVVLADITVASRSPANPGQANAGAF